MAQCTDRSRQWTKTPKKVWCFLEGEFASNKSPNLGVSAKVYFPTSNG